MTISRAILASNSKSSHSDSWKRAHHTGTPLHSRQSKAVKTYFFEQAINSKYFSIIIIIIINRGQAPTCLTYEKYHRFFFFSFHFILYSTTLSNISFFFFVFFCFFSFLLCYVVNLTASYTLPSFRETYDCILVICE